MRLSLVLVVVGLLAAACGQTGDDTTEISGSFPPTSSNPTTSDPEAELDIADLEDAAIVARSMLASELSVDEHNLKLISSQPVTWRDTALGCPQPDTAYSQVLVEGYLVVFEFDGVLYEIHQAADSAPIVCLEPTPNGFIPPTKQPPRISIPPPID